MSEVATSLLFEIEREWTPGPAWTALFQRFWPSYRKWYLSEGDMARPTYAECRNAIRQYMPQLESTWSNLCELAGGGDIASRFLSLYRPPPYLAGCSQAISLQGGPALVRNYDYSPELTDGLCLATCMNGTKVIASTDCLWGVLDGINEHGVAIALSFGGSRVVGSGFGAPIIVRAALETAHSTHEAIEIIRSIPSHMAYNISIVDAEADYATVYLAPGKPSVVDRVRAVTNHQHEIEWPRYAEMTESVERRRVLQQLIDSGDSLDELVGRFMTPPLYRTDHARGFGTLYTSVYLPRTLQVRFAWPHKAVTFGFDDIKSCALDITYPPGVA